MATWRGNDVLVQRRPRIWPYFAIAALAVGLPTAAEIYLVTALVLLLLVLLLFFLPAIMYDDQLRRVDLVAGDENGLWFGSDLVLPRGKIESCALEPVGEGLCNVHLWGPGRRDDISLLVADMATGQKLTDALGLKSERHAARFLVESAPLRPRRIARGLQALQWLGAGAIAMAVVGGAIKAEWIGFTLVPLMFAYFGLLRRLRRRRTITLGADAIKVGTTLPLFEIASVKAGPGTDAIVSPRSRDDLLLRFDGREAKVKRDAFVERLKKSLAGDQELPALAMLDPGEKGKKDWLDNLRLMGGDSYRGGGLPTEELWRVVEHVGAAPGARIGALAVLVSRVDGEGRMRLASIAEGTVKSDVRAALEAAAEEGATDELVVGKFER